MIILCCVRPGAQFRKGIITGFSVSCFVRRQTKTQLSRRAGTDLEHFMAGSWGKYILQYLQVYSE